MPVVNECDVDACAYNTDRRCHALAITVGDIRHAHCDTFFRTSAKGGDPTTVGHVGACKMSDCRAQRPVRVPGSQHHGRLCGEHRGLSHLFARLRPRHGRNESPGERTAMSNTSSCTRSLDPTGWSTRGARGSYSRPAQRPVKLTGGQRAGLPERVTGIELALSAWELLHDHGA
ncbi:DUF1540 domain-containing protein [Nonomuraea ferruginea]